LYHTNRTYVKLVDLQNRRVTSVILCRKCAIVVGFAIYRRDETISRALRVSAA